MNTNFIASSLGPGLDQDEPAQLFFRLGERAVGGGQLAVPHPDGGRRLERLQRVGDDEMAGIRLLLVIAFMSFSTR